MDCYLGDILYLSEAFGAWLHSALQCFDALIHFEIHTIAAHLRVAAIKPKSDLFKWQFTKWIAALNQI